MSTDPILTVHEMAGSGKEYFMCGYRDKVFYAKMEDFTHRVKPTSQRVPFQVDASPAGAFNSTQRNRLDQ